MKREFLQNLDIGEGARLSAAAIDAIMAEHGKTAGALQTSVTSLTRERDTLRTQMGGMVTQSKYDEDTGALNTRVTELQNTIAVRDARDKVSAETGVPAALLTGDTEEACRTQAEALNKWRGDPAKYPPLPDGGDTPSAGGGKTRDQFAEWFPTALSKGA